MHHRVDLGFMLLILVIAESRDLPSDVRSLLEFKKGIRSDPTGRITGSWDPSSIQSNGCPLDWHGVTCSDAGSVSAISLSELALEGRLKFSTLIRLESLTNLTLTSNSLSGRLVPAIGDMTSLQHLDLSGNHFYGPVPERITELWGLRYLNMSSNNFSGRFPMGMRNLRQLRVLDLHDNRLYGNLGVVFTELQSPEYIDLSLNSFYGQLFMDKSNLSSLAGSVKHVNLSYNKLNGGFLSPDSVRMFQRLEVLDLTHNQIAGNLPSFDSIPSLSVLRLGDNRLYGTLPTELFGSSLALAEMDLSGNEFSGSVPQINSTALKILNLSSNSLSGYLPSNLGNCTVLDLSNNQISGRLSAVKSWGSMLKYIDLSSNLLSGNFPNMTSHLAFLMSVNMRNNSLEGFLPSSLGKSPRLSVIDLSLNKLDGSIPSTFFTSLTLINMNLSGNHLSGTIQFWNSHSIESLVLPSPPKMEMLDISNNLLTGSLPPEIGSMGSLRLLNLGKNNLSGPLPNQFSRLSLLEDLDLSANSFCGKLPENLSPSLKAFNVSYNNLSGPIPEKLRKFPITSFQPGNKFLVVQPDFPTQSSNGNIYRTEGHRHSVISGLKILIVTGSVGSVMLIAFILLAFIKTQQQELQGTSGFCSQHTGFNIKMTRFRCPYLFSFHEVEDHPSTSLGFSNDQLLPSDPRLLSRQKNNAVKTARCSSGMINSPRTLTSQWKSSPMSHLPSPSYVESSVPDHLVPLSVCSPDRLVGELIFLDNSIVFTSEELSRSPAEVLGRSNLGASYRAKLDDGHVLTVKWLRVGFVKHKQGFAKEMKRIGTARHPNLVTPKAYYWGPRDREHLLVADYIEGGNLSFHLHAENLSPSQIQECTDSTPRRCPLLLNQRFKIALDIAHGLHYLHNERSLAHGNLKPTNILLVGSNPDVKLTDYGLHLLATPAGTAEQILNLGALGYCSPELANSQRPVPSFKADVYAFGVILMELLTRRSAGDILSGQSGAVDLPDWIRLCVSEGRGSDCFDRDLTVSEVALGPMEELLALSLRCISSADTRPSIGTVLEDLGAVSV